MFNNEKYVTNRIQNELSQELILFLWILIDEARNKTELDYLQIFHLSKDKINGIPVQKVTHTQEIPQYKNEVYFLCDKIINDKVYCIDDETHSTMLFANEY